MVQKILNALMYSAFGGGVASACLTGMHFLEKKRVASQSKNISTPNWDYNWDRREPSSLVKVSKVETIEDENKFNEEIEKHKPTATRNLILIRHGQYNTKGLTDNENFLTELGRKQADNTGMRIKALDFPYTNLTHSTMTRAIETAQLIQKHIPGIPVKSCDLLREGAPIQPDPPVRDWKPADRHFYSDGARIEAAFRKYFHRANVSQEKNSFEIIVCHANVIRYFVCRAMQFPAEGWLRFSLHHCSITWIAIKPNGRITTYLIGDCGHLPYELMTTS